MIDDHIRPEYKSNTLLTSSEREVKKGLRTELKFQRKLTKLENRIKHAIIRNDPVVERSAREELKDLLSKEDDCRRDGGQQCKQQRHQSSFQCALCPSNDNEGDYDTKQAALDEALSIFRRLLSSIDDIEKDKIRIEKWSKLRSLSSYSGT